MTRGNELVAGSKEKTHLSIHGTGLNRHGGRHAICLRVGIFIATSLSCHWKRSERHPVCAELIYGHRIDRIRKRFRLVHGSGRDSGISTVAIGVLHVLLRLLLLWALHCNSQSKVVHDIVRDRSWFELRCWLKQRWIL